MCEKHYSIQYRRIFRMIPPLILIFFVTTIESFAQDTTWTILPTPITNGNLNDLYFLSKDTGWAVGFDEDANQAAIIHTTDGGANWAVQPSGSTGDLQGVFFVDESIGYAVGYDWSGSGSVILKTTNGGQEWQAQTSPIATGGLSAVYFASPTKGWATGEDVSNQEILILHTEDGTTWAKSNYLARTGRLNALNFVGSEHGWAVGRKGLFGPPIILHTSDGGQNWVEQTHPMTSGYLKDVFFFDQDTGWAVGKADNDAAILKTTDGGASWVTLNSPQGSEATSVFFVSSLEGFVTMNVSGENSHAMLFQTTDGGNTWTEPLEPVAGEYIHCLNVVSGSWWLFAVFSYSNSIGSAHATEPSQLARIDVTPSSVDLEIGESQVFMAKGFDQNGHEIPITPSWSTDGGTIDQNGKYTATMAGDFTVTASVTGSTVTGTASVHATEPSQLARIDVTPSSVDLEIGESQVFIAKGYDQNGHEIPITPSWSTDGGTIDQNGKYTATTAGDYTVTASVEGSTVTGTATVHVRRLDVNGDHVVDGKDVQEVVVAVHNNSQNLIFDVNGDGKVDGRDIQEILNAIKRGGQGGVSSLRRFGTLERFVSLLENNVLSIVSSSGPVGSSGNSVAVNLTNDSTTALLQLDISYDSSILNPAVVNLSGRTTDFAAVFADTTIDMPVFSIVQAGLLRILVFDFDEDSLTQNLIQPDSGAVVEILFDVSREAPVGDSPLGIADPLLVNTEADSLPVWSQDGVFTVMPGALARIEVSPDSVTLEPGQSQQFTAAGTDSFGNPVSFQPVWSATGGTMDSTGLYTAGSDTGFYQVVADDSLSHVKGFALVHITTVTEVVKGEEPALPGEFALAQNYPNPFNPVTTIEFSVKEQCHVLLKVYDIRGREVATLVDAAHLPGYYQTEFEIKELASGVYIYRIQMGGFQAGKKMVVLR